MQKKKYAKNMPIFTAARFKSSKMPRKSRGKSPARKSNVVVATNNNNDDNTFPDVVHPIGPIEEIVDDVFFVSGCVSMAPGMWFARNMIIGLFSRKKKIVVLLSVMNYF
jgi:hypothetical protein